MPPPRWNENRHPKGGDEEHSTDDDDEMTVLLTAALAGHGSSRTAMVGCRRNSEACFGKAQEQGVTALSLANERDFPRGTPPPHISPSRFARRSDGCCSAENFDDLCIVAVKAWG
jgi:hypothetical protein